MAMTPLILAAKHGNGEVVSLLPEKGADIEAKNDDGKTTIDVTESGAIKDLLRKHSS